MKEIINVFVNDVKKICSRPIAIVIMIGLLIMPGIYAWLNIDSNWSPYDNTGNLPIAVVNNDEGTSFMGEDLNMGQMMMDGLKNNKAMQWVFTDEETAMQKVDASQYYGVIVIPKDFSTKFITLFNDSQITKPKFDFYVNQKKNPIAPIIVDKAADTIRNTVNQNFVNAVIYKVINTAEDMEIVTMGAQSTDELIQKLEDSNKKIDELRAILKAMALASDSTSKSLNAVRDLVPTASSITGTTKQGVSDMKNAAQSFSNTYQNMSDNIVKILDSSEQASKDLKELVNTQDANAIKENYTKMMEKTNDISNKLENLQNALTTINQTLHLFQIDDLQNSITSALKDIDEMQKMLSNINEAANNIDSIKDKANNIDTQIGNIKKTYNDTTKIALENSYANASTSLTGITSLATNLDASLGKTDSAMKNMISALNNTKELTDNIDIVLLGIQTDITKIINSLKEERASQLYEQIIKLLQNDPNAIADFLSTPVETNEIDIYYIDSYGAKMSPFYTVLASWVGCTILISILKTEVKKTDETKKLKNYQTFFGRFMLFGVMAVLQGLIIGIGDIILKVQVVNYPLFLLTIMISSIVFMMIVYALTLSFGKVGEALAIVFLVIQVAGSGGTFPIELLPRGFSILQPFMPFYPAMNALRETIGGFYANDYIKYILILLCHTIIPLLLGLSFRRRIVHLKRNVDRELEKTDLII